MPATATREPGEVAVLCGTLRTALDTGAAGGYYTTLCGYHRARPGVWLFPLFVIRLGLPTSTRPLKIPVRSDPFRVSSERYRTMGCRGMGVWDGPRGRVRVRG